MLLKSKKKKVSMQGRKTLVYRRKKIMHDSYSPPPIFISFIFATRLNYCIIKVSPESVVFKRINDGPLYNVNTSHVCPMQTPHGGKANDSDRYMHTTVSEVH